MDASHNDVSDLPNESRILIVEDSPTQAKKLEHLLRLNRYKITCATDGNAAIALMEHAVPDIVISDVLMPGMNGYELCRSIKSKKTLKHVPVMLLTTLSEPEDIIKGLACGANNFVIKPYDDQVLLSVIGNMFENLGAPDVGTEDMAFDIQFQGTRYHLTSDRTQIVAMLFSAFENMLYKTRELEKTHRKLTEAFETIKTLKGLLPICSNCKSIRNDRGYWEYLEDYISQHSDAQFTHGICPKCVRELYPELPINFEKS